MKFFSLHLSLINIFFLCLMIFPSRLICQTPLTRPEKSDYKETSTYADVLDFLDEVQLNATTDIMRMGFFGKTREGRDIPYVVLSSPAISDPSQALMSNKPIVFILNNIHGGETDGKEASLILIRDMTQGRYSHWLENVIILIVPLYNVDGNERVGKFNRMVQDGPEGGIGIRTNAAGFDLARDYMKVEQPEGEALASLFIKWWPHFTIDTHTNNGAYHDYAIVYAYPQNANIQPIIIDYLKNKMMPTVSKLIEQRSGYKSQVYGTFVDDDHPEKGWETYASFPRYGDRYRGLQNRLSVLLESYPYTNFKSRIDATYQFLTGCLDYVNTHPGEILEIIRKAEMQTIRAGNDSAADSIGVRFKMVEDDVPLQINAYNVKHQVDENGKINFNHVKDITTYTVPYIGKSIATKKVARPYAYIIPRAYEEIVHKLMQHGIAVEKIRRILKTEVEAYRITKIESDEQPYQGHRMIQLTTQVENQNMTFMPGTFIVRMQQPSANVAAFLLEPETPDGYAAWNYFDHIGEQNIIIDEIFLDNLGEKLLKKPEIRDEFERLAKTDPELKTDPQKRKKFIFEKSPYHNPNQYIFPVYRLMHKIGMATTLVRIDK